MKLPFEQFFGNEVIFIVARIPKANYSKFNRFEKIRWCIPPHNKLPEFCHIVRYLRFHFRNIEMQKKAKGSEV